MEPDVDDTQEEDRKWLELMRKKWAEQDGAKASKTTSDSRPFTAADDVDDDTVTAGAAVASLQKDAEDNRRKATLDKNIREFAAARKSNSQPADAVEIELLMVADGKDKEDDTVVLRFRGSGRNRNATREDGNRSSGGHRSSRGTNRSSRSTDWSSAEDSFLTAGSRHDRSSSNDRLDSAQRKARGYTDTSDSHHRTRSKTDRNSQRSHTHSQRSSRVLTVDGDESSVEAGENPKPPNCPDPGLTSVAMWWLELSTTKRLIVMGVVLGLVGLALLVFLLPASFVYVEYHQYALHRNKWTSAVDYSHVYDSGCFLMGPQDEMIVMPSTAHIISMRLAIMNKESMSITVEIMLEYFLKRDEIPVLFRRYHLGYDSVIRNVVESTVKNHAISITMEDYRLRREAVEQSIFETLQFALSGNCCSSNCLQGSGRVTNCTCDPNPDTCSHGKYVELRYFQMGQIALPAEVMDRYMRKIVTQIEAEREFHIQERAVVKKETTWEVQKLLHQAKERIEIAKAEAYRIRLRADARREKVIQTNYSVAMSRMFKDMGVTDEETKLSFIYLRALEKKQDDLLFFNYDTATLLTP